MARGVELNHAEIRKMLQSEEIIKELRRRGDAIAEEAQATGTPGAEYVVEEWVGANRSRVTIATDNVAAMVDEARNHTLLAALDAGRE